MVHGHAAAAGRPLLHDALLLDADDLLIAAARISSNRGGDKRGNFKPLLLFFVF